MSRIFASYREKIDSRTEKAEYLPMQSKQYYVYILSSISGVLYIGITNDLKRRVWEHKQGLVEGFTKKYNVKKLVYYSITSLILHFFASIIEKDVAPQIGTNTEKFFFCGCSFLWFI